MKELQRTKRRSCNPCPQGIGGYIKCWGANNWAQLSLGDSSTRGDAPGEMGNHLPLVDLGDGSLARQMVAGEGLGDSCHHHPVRLVLLRLVAWEWLERLLD